MDIKLEQTLYKRYPKLYRQKDLSMTQTCMCWNFECGSGWFKLIDTLSHFLSLSKTKIEATQVKEKFGTLRFYYSGGDDYTDNLISAFESASEHTCEQCGNWSKLRNVGWVYNMCDGCWEEFKLKRGIKEEKHEEK